MTDLRVHLVTYAGNSELQSVRTEEDGSSDENTIRSGVVERRGLRIEAHNWHGNRPSKQDSLEETLKNIGQEKNSTETKRKLEFNDWYWNQEPEQQRTQSKSN